MKVLALQLKRIGDLILTEPALAALRQKFPAAQITLGLTHYCEPLLPAFGFIDHALVLRGGKVNFHDWVGLISGKFDVCLDFTCNDRSAFCTVLSQARRRVTFEAAKKSRIRSLAYNRFVDSPVRDYHTTDHYCHLLRELQIEEYPPLALDLPESARARAAALSDGPYVVIHPGTARAEKLWVPERWAAVIEHIREKHQLECFITGSTDSFERTHIAQIQGALRRPCHDVSAKLDLLGFAAMIANSRACLSCDTAAVHLAAAFQRPQIALFGVTNPFHWRPRHARALVISASQPDAPLTEFLPAMKGAPMSTISTETVIRASDALLGEIRK